MKIKSVLVSIAAITTALFLFGFQKETQKEPWTGKQLMAPSELAGRLNTNKASNTVVFNIGPSGKIKNSILIGPVQEDEHMASFKKELLSLTRNTEVVIYCGCCPFDKCPNIRPAFQLLNELKFTNAKLLNLPKNLKADWIDKGYPMQN